MRLEIGCGKYRQKNVNVAIDILRDSLCDIVADAHNLPFKDGLFREVLMFEVLEHVKSPTSVLAEISRVLKSNGKLFMSIPNLFYFRHLLRWIVKGKKSSVSSGHINGWTLSELDNLLTANNFKLVSFWFEDYVRYHKPSKFARILPGITKHSLNIMAIGNRGCNLHA